MGRMEVLFSFCKKERLFPLTAKQLFWLQLSAFAVEYNNRCNEFRDRTRRILRYTQDTGGCRPNHLPNIPEPVKRVVLYSFNCFRDDLRSFMKRGRSTKMGVITRIIYKPPSYKAGKRYYDMV